MAPTPQAKAMALRRLRILAFGDLALALLPAVCLPLAAPSLPSGSVARLALALLGLVVAPGYLLMESIEPKSTHLDRLRHLLVGLGVGLPIAGLAALATAMQPGGFTAARIAFAEAATAVVLAVVACRRRAVAGSRAAPAARQAA